jgi:hypothetical protein
MQNLYGNNLKQGIHIQSAGVSVTAYGNNVVMNHCLTGDALFLDEPHDVLFENFGGTCDAGNTGNVIHIRGRAAGCYMVAPDGGGGAGTYAGTAYLIEMFGGNRPHDIHFIGGVTSSQGIGLSVDCDNFYMSGHTILSSQGDGIDIVGAGSNIIFSGVTVTLSNVAAGALKYDVNVTNTTGIVIIDKCSLQSLLATVTANLNSTANTQLFSGEQRATAPLAGVRGPGYSFPGNAVYDATAGNGHFWRVNGVSLGAVLSGGQVQAFNQMCGGAEAGGLQTVGWLHSVGIPANGNGNNNDWCYSDNGHLYRKTAGAWVQIV